MELVKAQVHAARENPDIKIKVELALMDLSFFNRKDLACNRAGITFRDAFFKAADYPEHEAYCLGTAALAMEALRPYAEEAPYHIGTVFQALYGHIGPVDVSGAGDDDEEGVPEKLRAYRVAARKLKSIDQLARIANVMGLRVVQAYPPCGRSFSVLRGHEEVGAQNTGVYSSVVKRVVALVSGEAPAGYTNNQRQRNL